MSRATRTNGRESGTGQDTPLGVCPCPAPLLATPCGTWRDIVPSCPAVTHCPLMESKAAATRFSGLTPQVPAALRSCLAF